MDYGKERETSSTRPRVRFTLHVLAVLTILTNTAVALGTEKYELIASTRAGKEDPPFDHRPKKKLFEY